MINGWLVGDASLIAKMEGRADAMQAGLEKSVQRLALQLLTTVKQKLSDDVLRVRTGRLRRSINQRVTVEQTSVTGIVGTNVEYARRLEFGFKGTENVRESLRHITQAFGKPLKAPMTIKVRAHTRKVDFPPHSFLRSALAEMRPQIERDMAAALVKAAREGTA
ncbi:HK97 gp10 family phage protein (plasmid) [Herbaspirillum seropedicae]|uniref:HK97 gp10 family phage protein n=1 Tax=Herbaspirillum seropedicae TaxID=964 RepID=UPI0011236CFE|nr:HK97 gp10 family phage protein [Herbaspirillum seropedicae]QDD62650.1 HK97 gp10 family phage protein [Herbaspirillum seropedicae]